MPSPPPHQRPPQGERRRSCPYAFEITPDGRLIIDGEDFGPAEDRLGEGERLRSIVRLWHEVAGGG